MIALDCSIAVSWCFEDEASEATDNLLNLVKEEGAYVPNLWHLEISNVLIQTVKRNRIQNETIPIFLELLTKLPIKTDMETHARAFAEIIELAQNNKLTSYDAAYLELAIRRNLTIASTDKALRKAANNLNIPIIPS